MYGRNDLRFGPSSNLDLSADLQDAFGRQVEIPEGPRRIAPHEHVEDPAPLASSGASICFDPSETFIATHSRHFLSRSFASPIMVVLISTPVYRQSAGDAGSAGAAQACRYQNLTRRPNGHARNLHVQEDRLSPDFHRMPAGPAWSRSSCKSLWRHPL
jgi:hypothetical protein